MLSLDPAKVLVVLVVALVVLGPDKLPRAARQVGAAWHQLRRWRARLEEEVRGTFPDLPPAHTISQAVRSPLSFLDRLADAHDQDAAVPDPGAPPVEVPASGPGTVAGAPAAPRAGSAPATAGTGPVTPASGPVGGGARPGPSGVPVPGADPSMN